MASKFSLEAILSLTDNMTGPYKRTTNKITGLNRGLDRSFNALNTGITRGLKMVSAVGLGALAAGVGLATREFISLDDSITAAGAKFSDVDKTNIASFTESLKELRDSARSVGKVTEFSATDSAGALDKFAMAGMNSTQSMALLMGTTNLATAANTDLTTAVDIATDSLGAFDKVVEDEIQLGKNLTQVSDQMAKTTTTANTSLVEMFESIKSGAPAFTAAGQEMSTFNSLVGKMANAGIKGSESGTNLRNIMLRLSKPTGEASDILKELGVQTKDSEGNFLDIIDIIGQFEKGLKGMGTAQRTAALTTVFGARAVTGMNVLLSEGSDSLREYRDEIENSTGSAEIMATAMRQSLGNRLKLIKSGLTELGLQFVESFEVDGKNALDQLAISIQNFDMTPIINGAQEFVKIIKGIDTAPAVAMFEKLLDMMERYRKFEKKAFEVLSPFTKERQETLAEINKIGESIGAENQREGRRAIEAMMTEQGGGPLFGRTDAERETDRAARDAEINRFIVQEAEKERNAAMERQAERYDIHLTAPAGYGMSTSPGGETSTALQLGEQ